MQLENIATPLEETSPQLRYASLHRAVERGMASDEVLRELVEICLQLGHNDEALRVHANMKAGSAREHVASRLARHGLLARSRNSAPTGGARPRASGSRSRVATRVDPVSDDDAPSIAEHVIDSIQFLCQAHMPAVALLTMLAFPLVVGVGGFLTAGGSLWLFAALATLPGLCVLGVVGAMGRQIFLQSADGEEEIPGIPAPAEMLMSAKRFLGDVLIVLGILVAPSLTLLWFEAPLVSSLPGLALGMFLTPIALILRQIRGDIGALSPVALVRGIGCCHGYLKVVTAFWLAYAPAAIAFWSTLGHAVWLQIAIAGPLAVLPTFATARLLGTFTEVNRARLGLLLYPSGRLEQTKSSGDKQKAAAAAPARRATVGSPRVRSSSATPQPSAPAPAAARKDPPSTMPKKPASLIQKALNATPQPGNVNRRPLPEEWMAETGPRKPLEAPAPAPAPAHIEGRAPTKRAARSVDPKQLSKKPVTRSSREDADAEGKLGGPDLSNMPGATVITGADRERMGAASRKA